MTTRGIRAVGPRTAGYSRHHRFELLDQDRSVGLDCFSQWPSGPGPCGSNDDGAHVRRRLLAAFETGCCHQLCGFPVRVEEVNESEGDILVMLFQRKRRQTTRFLRRLASSRARSEVPQCLDSALANDFLGDLVDCRKDAADSIGGRVVRDWAVGDREVSLFEVSMAIHFEEDVVHPRRRTAVKGGVDQRSEDRLDLGPNLSER